MPNHLMRIADRVINRPLMILPDKLALIAEVIGGRIGIDAAGLDASGAPSAPKPRADAAQRRRQGSLPFRLTEDGTAIIPVLGSLVNRGAWIGAYSGVTSYEGLKIQIQSALASDDVKAVVLDLESPGGEAIGAFEIAAIVREAAAVKPVTAVVNGMTASAAYAIASGASRIITTPSGLSGSIGVVMLHADYSRHLDAKGITPTLIHAGARKVDGNPYQPLTDDVQASLRVEIDKFYAMFVKTVAAGRSGLSEAAARATEAAVYIGEDAVAAGLADDVGSIEGVLADHARGRTPRLRTASGARLDLPAPAVTTSTSPASDPELRGLDAFAAGATVERQRIAAIFALPEASGREASARHMALNTGLSIDDVQAMLATVQPAAPSASLAARMAANPSASLPIGMDLPAARPSMADRMRARVERAIASTG